MTCERCGHPIACHAYDGPDGHYLHSWPCLACDCKAPSAAGPCANCGLPRASHSGDDCPVMATRYRGSVSYSPATSAGIAAIVAQIDAPTGFTADFRDGMDYLATELADRLGGR
jgi:hypothetical protein